MLHCTHKLYYFQGCDENTDTVWKQMTKAFREGLRLDSTAKPWTGRVTTQIQGASKQAMPHNFLHELVDLRWAAFAIQRKMDPFVDMPPQCLWVDLRQNLERQRRDGKLCFRSKSLPYNYSLDRCVCPEEMMLHMGYPDTFSTEDLTLKVPFWPMDCVAASMKKKEGAYIKEQEDARVKSMSRKTLVGPTLVGMVGNGMSLPDCTLIMYSSLLACDLDLWPQAAPDSFSSTLPQQGAAAASVVFDPKSSLAERCAMAQNLGVVE